GPALCSTAVPGARVSHEGGRYALAQYWRLVTECVGNRRDDRLQFDRRVDVDIRRLLWRQLAEYARQQRGAAQSGAHTGQRDGEIALRLGLLAQVPRAGDVTLHEGDDIVAERRRVRNEAGREAPRQVLPRVPCDRERRRPVLLTDRGVRLAADHELGVDRLDLGMRTDLALATDAVGHAGASLFARSSSSSRRRCSAAVTLRPLRFAFACAAHISRHAARAR